ILFHHMRGELDNLVRLYKQCGGGEGMTGDKIKQSIAAYLIACPVYRYYGKDIPFMTQDENSNNEELFKFYQRAMQFSGPLMAKGVEDTLMYTYNRFIGHNEVGDAPQAFGFSAEKFHELMQYRQKHWPLSLNTTSTHDTKRGEDARARLNALTDFYEEWMTLVRKWMMANGSLKMKGLPDGNDEYFIYQTLVATYPYLSGGRDAGNRMEDGKQSAVESYSQRIQEYLQKALREAKVHSNWAAPNADYEHATIQFARSLIKGENDFHKTFIPFQQKISDYGIINSLSQLLLKFTCPGIPDTYQGTELWDLSLVDPDNRRPVDYTSRKRLLAGGKPFHELWEARMNGNIKLALLHQLLKIRISYPDIFSDGEYIPLQIGGEFKNNAMAFFRSYKGKNMLVAIPLHLNQLSDNLPGADWRDTKIILPSGYNSKWEDKLKGSVVNDVYLNDVFQKFPLALLIGQ
nr:hypothetical protein [Chitinophagaceae bacterium]